MSDRVLPKRKKIRLDHVAYADPSAICSVTIATADRAPIFVHTLLAEDCIALLKSQAETTGTTVYAYCFMPDHLHLLLSPSSHLSLLDFVGKFKSLSTKLAWRYGYQGKIWQPRFYDHFLRKDEAIEKMVEYILNNPVHSGMVSEWRSYPFCGSLVYYL